VPRTSRPDRRIRCVSWIIARNGNIGRSFLEIPSRTLEGIVMKVVGQFSRLEVSFRARSGPLWLVLFDLFAELE